MTRRYARLAWAAAAATYLLIVLGGIVRITGSGLGCGNHWPICNGRLFPPLDDIKTLIEWNHRLLAAVVSVLVAGLAAYTWRLRGGAGEGGKGKGPSPLGYYSLTLLVIQVLLGAITVKLDLPPWTIILHLGTAMALFATLLIIARGPVARPPAPMAIAVPALGFLTVLAGALVANLGAASACLGFPLCNGQAIPAGNYLQAVHWTHRLLAYALTAGVAWWAVRARTRATVGALVLVAVQIGVGATMVLSGLPPAWQAAHVAAGTAVWGALVLAARAPR